ncbi:hypothetical protein D3C79_798290 [compost metagenome]
MGHHHHGLVLAGELLHQPQHLVDPFGIEGRGGLVKQDDLGVSRHGAAYADPLLLAAGQGCRVGILLVGEAYVLEDAKGGGPGLRLRLFPDGDQPLGYVVQRRLVGKQGVVLEHEGGALAQLDGLLLAGMGQIQLKVIDGKGACIRGLQQVQAAQQG